MPVNRDPADQPRRRAHGGNAIGPGVVLDSPGTCKAWLYVDLGGEDPAEVEAQAGRLLVLLNVAFYLILGYMPTYLSGLLGHSTAQANRMLVAIPPVGALSDRVGRKPLLLVAAAGYAAFSVPAVMLLGMPNLVLQFLGLISVLCMRETAQAMLRGEELPGVPESVGLPRRSYADLNRADAEERRESFARMSQETPRPSLPFSSVSPKKFVRPGEAE